MRKVIRFRLDDGIYELDASFIADQRAIYYAKVEAQQVPASEYSTAYKYWYNFEFNLLMEKSSDTYELIDWLLNNLTWHEIEPQIKKVQDTPKRSLKEQWDSIQASKHFEVLEID